jgi:hypothetical protein
MSKKKTKKWDKGSFMRAWAAVSQQQHRGWVETDDYAIQRKQWTDFADAMGAYAEEDGAVVPSEVACWNRIKTLQAALLKARPETKCPPFPNRPQKPSAQAPKTAADIAAELGW